MTNKILLLYNPRAGKGSFLQSLPQVIDMFVKAGFRVEVYPTQAPGDATSYLENSTHDYNMIVAAGGDGTLDEVVTGLINGEKRIPVGYIPVGSTNDYAESLGISSNVIECTGDIIAGNLHGVDVGVINTNHIFVYVAAFGAFTEVSYQTNQNAKNVLGHAAYLLEAIKGLGNIKAYPMKVTVDGVTTEQEYIYGMITNSISVGGMKNLPGKEGDVLLDDGLLEVTLIRNPKNPIQLQGIISCLLKGSRDHELIDSYQTDHIELECAETIPWTFDGEFGGNFDKVDVRDRKQAIDLVLGRYRPTVL